MHFDQLRALAAVVDEESFEAAAYALGISPSAVSQRIKALERSVGQVLIRRGSPCTPTATGEVLLRMARQVQLLAADTRAALGEGDPRPTPVPIAVNADSLSTWFPTVFAEAATWTDLTLELHVEDQDHSSRLLRRGDVLGAITTDPVPVAGCRVEHLGVMRYVPAAAPTIHHRYSTPTGVDWAAIPELRYSAKDGLQRPILNHHGVTEPPPTHTIPSADACLVAAKAGLGWAMFPELQLGTALTDGTLVLLDDNVRTDTALYWQTWTLASERVDRLSHTIRRAARKRLHQP